LKVNPSLDAPHERLHSDGELNDGKESEGNTIPGAGMDDVIVRWIVERFNPPQRRYSVYWKYEVICSGRCKDVSAESRLPSSVLEALDGVGRVSV
jgi:hypothetical protein